MSIEFAGDHMTLTEADDGSASMTFGPKPPGARVCGSCSLCCKLLPIPPLNKPAGKRCDYQRHGKGCTIYAPLAGLQGAPASIDDASANRVRAALFWHAKPV